MEEYFYLKAFKAKSLYYKSSKLSFLKNLRNTYSSYLYPLTF